MNHTNDPTTIQATQWLAALDNALIHSDIPAALALFADECYWRDLMAFTWNIVTLESQTEIRDMLAANLRTFHSVLDSGNLHKGDVAGRFFIDNKNDVDVVVAVFCITVVVVDVLVRILSLS